MNDNKLSILFVTGNARKMGEAQLGCGLYGVEVEQLRLDISEIQSADPHEVTLNKAQQAFAQVGKPLVVCDTFWNIPALNGFPGAYMKDIAQWFTPEDFLSLMRDKKDRRVSFTECVMYIDAEQTKEFCREYWGEIVVEPRGTGNSIERIAAFDGYTIGERRNQGVFSHEPEDYHWAAFAQWYIQQ